MIYYSTTYFGKNELSSNTKYDLSRDWLESLMASFVCCISVPLNPHIRCFNDLFNFVRNSFWDPDVSVVIHAETWAHWCPYHPGSQKYVLLRHLAALKIKWSFLADFYPHPSDVFHWNLLHPKQTIQLKGKWNFASRVIHMLEVVKSIFPHLFEGCIDIELLAVCCGVWSLLGRMTNTGSHVYI